MAAIDSAMTSLPLQDRSTVTAEPPGTPDAIASCQAASGATIARSPIRDRSARSSAALQHAPAARKRARTALEEFRASILAPSANATDALTAGARRRGPT